MPTFSGGATRMLHRTRLLLASLGDAFWLIPALMVLAGVFSAIGLVRLDASGVVPHWLIRSDWLYNGGGTGARTLLGTIAASAIGVAGTVFSITIAALSLAAGQMGPRLLRNFTQDRGNQVTLGAFLGTFCYALMVLRSVRTQSEGEFVPYLSLSIGILLAFLCVATLVYFVNHMAGRINVDTVIELVSTDLRQTMRRLCPDQAQVVPPPARATRGALITPARSGYVTDLAVQSLADWADRHEVTLELLLRPGDYVFPGAPIALCHPPHAGAAEAVTGALSLGAERSGQDDLAYPVRQLVEVAVRALSAGINDPHTAMSVLDRFGAALCELTDLYLPAQRHARRGRCVLTVAALDYGQLTDAMLTMVRQNALGNAAIYLHMLKVLLAVASCERTPVRVASLRRHAGLIVGDAGRSIASPADLDAIAALAAQFERMCSVGPQAVLAPAPEPAAC